MLFEIAKALKSLSPGTQAIAAARRQANHYVVAGNAHRAAGGGADGADRGSRKSEPEGFMLPRGVHAVALAGAIRRELLGRGIRTAKLPKATPTPFVALADGQAIVPWKVVLALGYGDIGCGEGMLQQLIDGLGNRRASLTNTKTASRGLLGYGATARSALRR